MKQGPNEDNKIIETNRRGGNFISALLKVMGLGIIFLVILTAIPVAAPRLFKLQTYNVASGSMEPQLPVGSLIYVKEEAPENLDTGDVILYAAGNTFVVHRIVENNREEETFITKGDANAENDPGSTMYSVVIGKVVFHLPFLGRLLVLYAGIQGKIAVLCFAAFGAVLSLIADRLRNRKQE